MSVERQRESIRPAKEDTMPTKKEKDDKNKGDKTKVVLALTKDEMKKIKAGLAIIRGSQKRDSSPCGKWCSS